jgi:hypothetical protein
MTISGRARTARARATRTAAKHERWARELRAFGWSVVEAGHITVHASVLSVMNMDTASLHVWCERCDMEIADWQDRMDVGSPLPQVLAKVSGHTCEPAG